MNLDILYCFSDDLKQYSMSFFINKKFFIIEIILKVCNDTDFYRSSIYFLFFCKRKFKRALEKMIIYPIKEYISGIS